MDYNSNTADMLARLKFLKAVALSGVFSDALAAGLNAGMGVMKRRIFNQSLDANGQTLGPYYSEQYARDRRRDGRQTERKDLENEGTLRRSIETVTINNIRAEVRFTSPEEANIGRWQEQQIYNLRTGRPANEASGGRVPIFEFNAAEAEIARTTSQQLLLQKLNI
jgi:hypothetical protein